MFSRRLTKQSTAGSSAQIERLKQALDRADAVVIGAGAGLSASAGLTYCGARFELYFKDFADKYGIRDMYSGGFYPFASPEEYWAWWSRHIMVNRYESAPKPVYDDLLNVVENKDYFVQITSFNLQALIKSGCFTPKEIMDFGSVRSPAIKAPMTMKKLCAAWLQNSGG